MTITTFISYVLGGICIGVGGLILLVNKKNLKIALTGAALALFCFIAPGVAWWLLPLAGVIAFLCAMVNGFKTARW